ncbi:TPA: DUF554 domain-containing protein [Streptococcus agalactiae]|nr:DUF554 domain-containing protein [Streptococcus agalactiae]
MVGLGTVINVILIIVGGFVGLFLKNFLKESLQKSLMQAMGVAVLFISISGVLEKMMLVEKSHLISNHTNMMIITLALGTVLGELLSLDSYIDKFGNYLKQKTGSGNDIKFVEAFVTSTCTVCIGAMAVDGIAADHSILFAKGMLDMIIIAIMTVSLGKGALFSALPVALLQGSLTIVAFFMGSLLNPSSLDYLNLVGNMLIFCVGVNLLFNLNIKVINMLPAIILAILWGSFI